MQTRASRLLAHNLHRALLLQRPSLLPSILRVLRAALFPNNAPAPARPVPSPDERSRIKRRCADAVLAAVPEPVAARLLGGDDDSMYDDDDSSNGSRGGGGGPGDSSSNRNRKQQKQIEALERLLDLLADSYLNKHLVYAIVERLALRLLPELGDAPPTELLRLRLGDPPGSGHAAV